MPLTPADFACPRCDKSPLDPTTVGLACRGCKIEFPSIGGFPWLFAEPAAAMGEWRGRMHFLLQTLENREAELTAASEQKDTGATTRQRLALLAQANAAHRASLSEILAPLNVAGLTAERTTYLALRTRLPSDQGLLTYFGNVHRDWNWGETENSASLEIIRARLDGRAAGRTLVLGSGAGRLAHDVHANLAPTQTVAIDFNPLLVFIAGRMSRGETLDMYEFPLAPIDLAHSAVLRTLRAPAPASVDYLIADVHRPPFPARSFDTVITPWLVDILPEPFPQLAQKINRLLTDDGHWINFGSLSFHDANPARQYSPEECVAMLPEAGFAGTDWHDSTIPYLCSPASRHARTENVVSWSASKARHIGTAARHEALPDWIVRGKDPVPVLEHFRTQTVSTRIHGYILSLIDGRRSINDMAAVLEQQQLMPRAEAEPAIRQFIIRLFEDARRGVRY